MGTRHLIIVRSNNKIKVAQYGQWDGYLTGQGVTIQNFLKNNFKGLHVFKHQIDACSFVSNAYIDRLNSKILGHNKDLITFDESDKLRVKLPEYHRDTGAKILDLINSGNVCHLKNDLDFIKDGLFCEYSYVIDLDLNEVVIFESGMSNKIYQGPIDEFIKLDLKKFEVKLNK